MTLHWPTLRWDIFCRVIDNLGDIGVCWRLSQGLAAQGQQVRLWIDQPEALRWMAPGALEGTVPGIEVITWVDGAAETLDRGIGRSDVWIEAFGCEPPARFIEGQRAQWAHGRSPVWINLEYLSAEPYVERMHRLPSPLMNGPGKDWTRWFFYPGFTAATGGLLREAHLMERRAAFDTAAWRARVAPSHRGRRWISLFCYEPAALPGLLATWEHDEETALLVTPGRAETAVAAWLGARPWPAHWHRRPLVSQSAFDDMLWSSDLNFVRGEDSLVRALWAGRPFVWQIYPQDDDAHHGKLEAFLDWLKAPEDLRALYRMWNGIDTGQPVPLDGSRLEAWTHAVLEARQRLLSQSDLVTQLLGFVTEKR